MTRATTPMTRIWSMALLMLAVTSSLSLCSCGGDDEECQMSTVTKQQLENASRDADDLGRIVNGASTDPDVVTRLGRTVPTVAKIISGMPQWLGWWSPATNYSKGAIVGFAGGSYLSVQDNNLNQSPAGNGAWWAQIAAMGEQGIQGVQGIQGPQGPSGPAGAPGSAAQAWGIVTVSGGGTTVGVNNLETGLGMTVAKPGTGLIVVTFLAPLGRTGARPCFVNYNGGLGPANNSRIVAVVPDSTHLNIFNFDGTNNQVAFTDGSYGFAIF